MNSIERQKDRALKDEIPRLVGAQYATGDQWRNNSRKNEEMEPKQKQYPFVDVTGAGSKWVKSVSCVRLFVTPWTVAYQASQSMGFSRQ